ncbi:PREDICTED: vestitone reductase-like [Ipomoea nil]|uniref:vestitone reductase-like n=1 Tax=Ipomoea nil TaxID=35883 RepID=UPI000901A1CC|nr:PREDICTED: vestitone reductase-like [Ipomoea nil]
MGGNGDGKGTVCVTGGTGFLASWLIMRLLEDGYSVNTTVRSLTRDLSYLTSLPGASPERLRIFEADLDRPESFQAAVEECVGVFHVAHPMDLAEGSEIEEAKIESAVNGTLGVLRAAVGAKTVKRVVVTSSRLAVVFNGDGGGSAVVVDESSWTDVGLVKESKPFGASYVISKTLAEKAALEFGEKYELDVVTVITSWIHGPFLSPQFPETLRPAMSIVLGDQENVMKYPSLTPFVHVDDAARAHIFLMEHPNAKGRYICSSLGITPQDLHKFLSTKYPQYHLPDPDSLKDMGGFKHPILSSKKLLDMGFKFKYGLEEMYDGAIESCKRVGFL